MSNVQLNFQFDSALFDYVWLYKKSFNRGITNEEFEILTIGKDRLW